MSMKKEAANLLRQRRNMAQRRFQRRRKLEAIMHYGGKCACCGETGFEFLTIDHVNGGGSKQRRKDSLQIGVWLKKHKYPVDFQVLCYNCNLGRNFWGQCPHKTGGAMTVVEVAKGLKKVEREEKNTIKNNKYGQRKKHH